MSYTHETDAQRGDCTPQVVCAWCGVVIRSAAAKDTLRTCQPCFTRMMREHGRAHRQDAGRCHASER